MGLASLRGREDRDSARAGVRFATVNPAQRIGRHGTAQGDTLAPRLLPRDGENVVIDARDARRVVIATGTPTQVSADTGPAGSATGRYLAAHLAHHPR